MFDNLEAMIHMTFRSHDLSVSDVTCYTMGEELGHAVV